MRFFPAASLTERARPNVASRGRLLWLIAATSVMPVVAAFNAAAVAQAPSVQKKPVEPPQELTLETRDQVQLKATFFPGSEGQESVPLILVHQYKGNRRDFTTLATYLQEQGHAVMVPDLRGHGESVNVAGSNRRLDADRFSNDDFKRMVNYDMETVKARLMQYNNEGKLNIDKLCVVGAEMGAVVALNWAALDWSWPPLATGKQGQDVKALVLISPPQSFRGLLARTSLTAKQRPMISEMSFYVAAGSMDSSASRDATSIHKIVERFHPAPEDPMQKAVFLDTATYRTRLQGTALLAEPSLPLKDRIAQFVELRLVKQPYPWKDRTSPLQ